jgi:hypothetical protein
MSRYSLERFDVATHNNAAAHSVAMYVTTNRVVATLRHSKLRRCGATRGCNAVALQLVWLRRYTWLTTLGRYSSCCHDIVARYNATTL